MIASVNAARGLFVVFHLALFFSLIVRNRLPALLMQINMAVAGSELLENNAWFQKLPVEP